MRKSVVECPMVAWIARIVAFSSSVPRRVLTAPMFGWLKVWLPMSCPSSYIRRTTSGNRSTFWPTTKNVPFTPRRSSSSRISGV